MLIITYYGKIYKHQIITLNKFHKSFIVSCQKLTNAFSFCGYFLEL